MECLQKVHGVTLGNNVCSCEICKTMMLNCENPAMLVWPYNKKLALEKLARQVLLAISMGEQLRN